MKIYYVDKGQVKSIENYQLVETSSANATSARVIKNGKVYSLGRSTVGTTKVLMHFNESAIKDECGNSWSVCGSSGRISMHVTGHTGIYCENISALTGSEWTIDFYLYQVTGSYHRIIRSAVGCLTCCRLEWGVYSGDVVPKKEWCHVAISYRSGTLYFFVNGVLQASGNASAFSSPATLYIGGSTNSWVYFGAEFYIDEFRVSNTCRWTSNFTSPTGDFVKDSYTKALLHFKSSITADECGNSWLADGTPTIDVENGSMISSTQSKFGGKSLYLNGSNALLINDLNLVSSEWTIDYWLYALANDTHTRYIEWVGSTRNCHKGAGVEYNGGIRKVDNSQLLNEWTHIAIVNTSSEMIFFRNGVKLGSTPSSANITRIGIGYNIYSNVASNNPSYLDEFRISSIALWTSNFTPPTSAGTVQ